MLVLLGHSALQLCSQSPLNAQSIMLRQITFKETERLPDVALVSQPPLILNACFQKGGPAVSLHQRQASPPTVHPTFASPGNQLFCMANRTKKEGSNSQMSASQPFADRCFRLGSLKQCFSCSKLIGGSLRALGTELLVSWCVSSSVLGKSGA